ncbi:MAG: hypothetical protein V2I57_05120 [Xanthomonadales bacterium]|jgi:hypothetical protein|nr:hypothetical protein [Xanthomonadales bacterium]
MRRPIARAAALISLLSALLLLLAVAPTTVQAQASSCPPNFGNGKLCTANDFNVTSVVVNGPDECTIGETIAIDLLVGLTSTANERYDVGLFVADNGGEVIGGPSCSFTSLTPQTDVPALFRGTDPAGEGPFRDLEGDACGDVAASDGENYRLFSLTSVLCQDRDGDGDVDINGLVVWSQNANQDVCTDPNEPAEFFPDQSSKCQLAPNYNLPITVEPRPTLEVEKRAAPRTLQEPGGPVVFLVSVGNTSADTDPLVLTSLVDDVHGDLNGRGTCSVPQVIAPGTTYACRFIADVTGIDGDTEIDVVTATAEDDDGEVVTAFDDAVVEIIGATDPTPPSISVVKLAYPRNVPEPGGTVLYVVEVTNTSDTEDVTLTALDDDLYGDVFTLGDVCASFSGITLAPGERFFCAFRQTVSGQPGDAITDVITAVGESGGLTATGDDDATVTIIDTPSSLTVKKTAFPQTRPAPGGTFAFRLDVQNSSAVDTVTISSLEDDVYGDLSILAPSTCSVPQTLAPSEVYSCAFAGDFTGGPGQFQVDSILVQGVDDDGNGVRAVARAQVELTSPQIPAPPALSVIKTANPTSLPEPGGSVTFTVEVINASPAGDITITALEDDPYGDITALPGSTCATGAVLTPDPNDVYRCSFTVDVVGAGGDELLDVVTVTGTAGGVQPVTASDDATVAILPVTSEILVTKSASPRLLSAPGGPVEFTVTVSNTGAETVELTALDDNIYGNLDGRGDCAIGIMLPPGDIYRCRFTENVNGPSPTLHLDTVTVAADAASGPVLYDSARALVLIFSPLNPPGSRPVAVPASQLWFLLVLVGLMALLAGHALRR